jgi:hypothetical protein
MPLSAAMMNGSLVSDTSPSSTVTAASLSAACSWARAAGGQASAHAARRRAADRFRVPIGRTFVMVNLSVGCAARAMCSP